MRRLPWKRSDCSSEDREPEDAAAGETANGSGLHSRKFPDRRPDALNSTSSEQLLAVGPSYEITDNSSQLQRRIMLVLYLFFDSGPISKEALFFTICREHGA